MQLYTLTKRFIPKDLINEFTSVIWTERYSAAGDMQLVVPATAANVRMLKQGIFVGLKGTKEIMILETHSVEKGLLTVTGSSLVKFLDERHAWFRNTDFGTDSPQLVAEYTVTTSAAQMISTAVQYMVISPGPYSGIYARANLDWDREKIPGLELGHVSETGTQKQYSFPLGSLYDGIQRLATDAGVGFKLYLESAKYSTQTWVLKFATYLGKNRTSNQSVNELVRLTPRLDSLSDVKEIGSLANYKNVIYVNYKNEITVHYTEPTLPIPEGFDRRVLLVEAPDLYFDSTAKITAFREQVARNEAAKHIYVQAVDGQVSSQIGYEFGTDYGLGDIIELEGFTGALSKARITEYIRSQDQFGEREYPTLSVIDPLFTGYMPDVEPDPDEEPPGPGDPDIDDDYPDGDGDGDGDGNGDRDPEPPDPDDPNPDPDPEPPDDGDEEEDGEPFDLTPLPAFNPLLAVGYRAYIPTAAVGIVEGEAIGYVGSLTLAKQLSGGDFTPLYWTEDNNIVAITTDVKGSTAEFPSSVDYTFWLVGGSDGSETKQITSTVTTNKIIGTHRWGREEQGSLGDQPAGMVYFIGGELRWYLTKFLDPAHDGAVELHVSTNGRLSGMERIIGPGNFEETVGNAYLTDVLVHPSPDGSKLLLDIGGKLWVCGSDGSGLKSLGIGAYTDNPISALSYWTPNGDRIYGIMPHADYNERHYYRLFSYDVDSDELNIIADFSTEPPGPWPPWGPLYVQQGAVMPVISPDGSTLAYQYETSMLAGGRKLCVTGLDAGAGAGNILYTQEIDDYTLDDPDMRIDLVMGKMAWGFDNSELFIVDNRGPSAVYRTTLDTLGGPSLISGGEGWGDPDSQIPIIRVLPRVEPQGVPHLLFAKGFGNTGGNFYNPTTEASSYLEFDPANPEAWVPPGPGYYSTFATGSLCDVWGELLGGPTSSRSIHMVRADDHSISFNPQFYSHPSSPGSEPTDRHLTFMWLNQIELVVAEIWVTIDGNNSNHVFAYIGMVS